MTKKELQHVKTVLQRIKNSDEHVAKAVAYVDKDLAQYAARRGQLRDTYNYDSPY